MILYKASKAVFLSDVAADRIADAVAAEYRKAIGRPTDSEFTAWASSLKFMGAVLDTDEISDGCTVCIEYMLPIGHSRIDFIIAGKDSNLSDNVVIVELKQWSKVRVREGRDLLEVDYGRSRTRPLIHPSYQAYSYAVTLREYNECIEQEGIGIYPCAYMHNYLPSPSSPIADTSLFPYVADAPLFTIYDNLRLRSFIRDHVSLPDTEALMDMIDSSRLRPSKSLQDALSSMLKGNREFMLLDSQKLVFEDVMYRIRRLNTDSSKRVFIIKGGPGTGKSVVAIRLLAESVAMGMNAAYVSKNSAPRNVYQMKLAEDGKEKALIDGLFLGSGHFVNALKDSYDVLIADEAHRLNRKSGIFGNKGENQIKEIINASRISVFLIDEEQKVTSKDIGSIDEIRRWAAYYGIEPEATMELSSQFRCSGSDGYIDFLDDILGIEERPYTFSPDDYGFHIMDSPSEMFMEIQKLNKHSNNKARMLAGYCWDWDSRKDPDAYDIEIGAFRARWNYSNTKTWAIDPESVDEVGCIHTSQGLEFRYCGVIIGPDLRYENGKVITDFSKRSSMDKSLTGLIGRCRKGDEAALKEADIIIRNTYRTLLSRAMLGTYVYCTDKALADYFRERLSDARSYYSGANAAEQGKY